MNKTRALSAAVLPLVVAALLSCKTNHAPDAPAVTAGPQYCLEDSTYTFSAAASDRDGDSVAVRFDWGDSTFSHWVGWFASGETVAFTHAWSDTGTYEVRVSVQDRQRTSDPSEGYVVQVVIRFPPETPVMPHGPDVGGLDSSYWFMSGADHPDGLPVAIRFAWGDGDTSEWSEFDLPGAPTSAKHTWSTPDTYLVTAQAKDTGELTSLWSAPDTIVIRPRDTMRLWRVRLTHGPRMSHSSPAIAPDGTIYVGSPDSALYAVNPDGIRKWRYLTGGGIQSSPALAPDGTIYFGAYDSCLYAVSPDGTLKWKYVTGGVVLSSPAIAADGTICFGSNDYCLYALNPNGTLKWSFLTGAAVTSSPAIGADGTVYFSSGDPCIYALNPDGSPRWQYVGQTGTRFASTAIGSDGTIYCGTRSDWEGQGSLCAFNPDGSLKWSFPSGGGIRFSPAIAVDGTIYFGSDDWWWGGCGFYGLNSDGTHKLYSEPSGFHPSSSPAINAVGTVYMGSYDSCLYAFYPDGTTKWRYQTGGYVESSPTIGSDGTIYFTSEDGYLYALKGTSPLANSPWPKFHHDLQNTGRTDQGGWSRLSMVGQPRVDAPGTGFAIQITNEGTEDVSINSLEFLATSATVYMRSYKMDVQPTQFLAPSDPGFGPGDSINFTQVAIAPDMVQLVDIYFADFRIGPQASDPPAPVSGRTFGLRFSDGSVIAVTP